MESKVPQSEASFLLCAKLQLAPGGTKSNPGSNELVQDFSTRFMRTYDSILADVKPPPSASKLHYVYAFSSEFTLLLRERIFVSLTDMMDDAIEVEVKLTTSNKTKQKNETKRVKVEEPQASTSQSSSDAEFNMMMKTMEKLMDKLYVDDKNQTKNQNEPQVRNPNFRRQQGPHAPQVMPSRPRNPNEQQIRPPFQENLIDEDFIEKPLDHIHQFGDEPEESDTFVTKDKHDNFVSQEDEGDKETREEESKDYHKAYLNAMLDLSRQYNLRNGNVVVGPPKKALEGQTSASHPAKNQHMKEVV